MTECELAEMLIEIILFTGSIFQDVQNVQLKKILCVFKIQFWVREFN